MLSVSVPTVEKLVFGQRVRSFDVAVGMSTRVLLHIQIPRGNHLASMLLLCVQGPPVNFTSSLFKFDQNSNGVICFSVLKCML